MFNAELFLKDLDAAIASATMDMVSSDSIGEIRRLQGCIKGLQLAKNLFLRQLKVKEREGNG